MLCEGGAGTKEAFLPEKRVKAISLRLVMEQSLTKEELAEYKSLSGEGTLDRARSLTNIHLEWQQIAEIANLEPFESAESLYLQYNRIERIQGLESLPHLQFLALQHNRITKVENLSCLRQLLFLDLSANSIAELDESELPENIGILNLSDNLCTQASDYRERLLLRLPELALLDGEQLKPVDGEEAALPEGPVVLDQEEPVAVLDSPADLSAFEARKELESSMYSKIANDIQAYGVEAVAEAEGFGQQVEEATARSYARRKELRAAFPGAGTAPGSRPGTASGNSRSGIARTAGAEGSAANGSSAVTEKDS